MYSIGVDIGGMSVKVGLVDEKGNILCKSVEKTALTPEQVIENLIKQIETLLKEADLSLKEIKGIGIGCPGAINGTTGVVDLLVNLNWNNVPLVNLLKNKLDTTIRISNDANVAVLAEALYGSAKDYNSLVMFTLGTGVGSGIVIDKKLYEGNCSKGAEIGHTTLVLGGKDCPCGRKGCVEQYVSATALISQTKDAMLLDKNSLMWEYVDNKIDNVNGKTAFECAKRGDKTALKVVDTYVCYLAESMINVFNTFRPEAFIIGGGISAQGDYLLNKVVEYCEKFDYGYKCAPKTKILIASLGNDAGIIGASALVRD